MEYVWLSFCSPRDRERTAMLRARAGFRSSCSWSLWPRLCRVGPSPWGTWMSWLLCRVCPSPSRCPILYPIPNQSLSTLHFRSCFPLDCVCWNVSEEGPSRAPDVPAWDGSESADPPTARPRCGLCPPTSRWTCNRTTLPYSYPL